MSVEEIENLDGSGTSILTSISETDALESKFELSFFSSILTSISETTQPNNKIKRQI